MRNSLNSNEEILISENENITDKNFLNNPKLINEKNVHKNSINCLIKCTNFKLNLTIKIEDKSRTFTSSSNCFYYNNSTTHQILNLLKKKEELNEKITNEFLLDLSIKKINEKDNKLLNKEIDFPIENDNNKQNKIIIWENPTILLSNNGNNNTSSILIEFNLNNSNIKDKSFFEVNKYFLNKEFNFSLNGIVHKKESLLKNDILFSIYPKIFIKSIQYRIEEYKKNYFINKQKGLNFVYKSYFFTPLNSQSNIGFSFYVNNKKKIINIDSFQTNFNSIIHKNFILDKLYIGINIPNYLAKDDNEKLNLNNNAILFSENNLVNQSENINEIFSKSFNSDFNKNNSLFHSPKKKAFNLNKKYNNNKENFFYFENYNKFNIQLNDNPLIKNSLNNYSGYYNNKFFRKKNFFSYHNEKMIILNQNDLFTNNIFNKYKDEKNTLCNLLIFNNLIQIHNPNNNELTIENIFNSFSKINILNLDIPYITNEGKIQNIIFIPTLSNFFLIIKDNELVENVLKSFPIKSSKSSSSTKSSNEENINDFIFEDIKIKILNSNEIIFEFNETKPYFLRDCLIEKIQKILNYLKLKNVNISKIDIEKSFFSISWVSINNNFSNTNILSFYYLNLKLIGILPLKFEKEIWIKPISFDEKNYHNEYENFINNNRNKIEYFLNIILSNYSYFFSYPSEYEFYLKNKK